MDFNTTQTSLNVRLKSASLVLMRCCLLNINFCVLHFQSSCCGILLLDSGLDFPWKEKVYLDIFPLKSPQTGHRCMFAQAENKSKPNANENTTASTKPAQSRFWFSLQGFLREPEKPRSRISYSQNLPAAETKFTFKQSEQTSETQALCVSGEEYYSTREKPTEGLRYQIPMSYLDFSFFFKAVNKHRSAGPLGAAFAPNFRFTSDTFYSEGWNIYLS